MKTWLKNTEMFQESYTFWGNKKAHAIIFGTVYISVGNDFSTTLSQP